MRYRPKLRILKKENSNDQKALKEILNILSHEKNANQNYFDILFYTCQNGKKSTKQVEVHTAENVEKEKQFSIAGGSENGNEFGGALGSWKSIYLNIHPGLFIMPSQDYA